MNVQSQPIAHTQAADDKDWWRGAVIYQIYPRSFQDSNDDGIGDLAGIIHRLPYIADLGAEAIWISPFFRSPMLDFGYDVSDYCDVDPMFGTLADFDALVTRAHELGIKVIIDLVLSHTSSIHPWFQESRTSHDNAKSDWFVWADPKPDGTPPNNWLSIFGGSAWEWDGGRMQYYLHNFLADQPDLNLHNMEVQDALLDVTRFWLERGVDGFRLDTVNFYFHDQELRDNPALSANEIDASIAPSVNPYNFQDHLYSKSRPENLDFLKRFRLLLDEYGATTSVGEVGDNERGMEIQGQYTKGEERLHMCYGFEFLSAPPATGLRVADVIGEAENVMEGGWACWSFSNHDVERHASRWQLSDAAQKVYAGLMMALKGTVCLYQGEELGLTEAYVSFEDLQDPYGKRFWPNFKGRDGCRTPMPWTSDSPYGGFSTAKPWLPVAMEHLSNSVAAQCAKENSLHAAYKQLIALRKAHPALQKGSIEMVDIAEGHVSFIREHAGQRIFCAFNLSDTELTLSLPAGTWRTDNATPFTATATEGAVRLPAFQAYFGIADDSATPATT
ncbi:MAG: alpha-glucosidase [Pseudomonadota bacterium]